MNSEEALAILKKNGYDGLYVQSLRSRGGDGAVLWKAYNLKNGFDDGSRDRSTSGSRGRSYGGSSVPQQGSGISQGSSSSERAMSASQLESFKIQVGEYRIPSLLFRFAWYAGGSAFA